MSKHEARTSLLGGSSSDYAYSMSQNPPPDYTNSYVPQYDTKPEPAYHNRSKSGSSFARSNGYATVDTSYATEAGGYHQREGYAVGDTGDKGSSWAYRPDSKWQWAFVGIVLGQAAVGLALEIYIFAHFEVSVNGNLGPHGRTVPTYLSLFIFGFVYELYLTYDALRMKNTIQVIGLCIYNFGLLIEAAVQSGQIHEAVNFLPTDGDTVSPMFWSQIKGWIYAVPGVIALGSVLMCLVTWKLYHEFAWSIYKDISADLRLKRRFLSYQIYIALLKFDFFFFLAFTVQFLVVVTQTADVELYLTIAAIPVTIVLLFMAAWWAKRESVPGMIVTIVVDFAGLAYFFFKLFRMYFGPPQRVNDYLPTRRSLTTFAIITVLCLLVTIVYAIIVSLNFNKGLKPHINGGGLSRHQRAASLEMSKLYGSSDGRTDPGLGASTMHGGLGPSRIMID